MKPPKQTWCSQACLDEYFIRSSASFARRKVMERDKGICALCGVDAERLREIAETELRRVEALPAAEREHWHPPYANLWRLLVEMDGRDYDVSVYFNTVFYPNRREIQTLWQADHILPVAEGGGGCGLDNYRTLCFRCHPKETGQLRRRLNRRRAAQQSLPEPT